MTVHHAIREAYNSIEKDKKFSSHYAALKATNGITNYIPYFFGDSNIYQNSDLPYFSTQPLSAVFKNHIALARETENRVLKQFNPTQDEALTKEWLDFFEKMVNDSLQDNSNKSYVYNLNINKELKGISDEKLDSNYLQGIKDVVASTERVLDLMIGEKHVSAVFGLLKTKLQKNFLTGKDIDSLSPIEKELIKDFKAKVNNKFINFVEEAGGKNCYDKLSAKEQQIMEAYKTLQSLGAVAQAGYIKANNKNKFINIFLNTKNAFMSVVPSMVGGYVEQVATGMASGKVEEVPELLRGAVSDGIKVGMVADHRGNSMVSVKCDLQEDSLARRMRSSANAISSKGVSEESLDITKSKVDVRIRCYMKGNDNAKIVASYGLTQKNSIHIKTDATTGVRIYDSKNAIKLWETSLAAALERKQIGYSNDDIKAFVHLGAGHGGQKSRPTGYKGMSAQQKQYSDADIQKIWDNVVLNLKARIAYTAIAGTTNENTMMLVLNMKAYPISEIFEMMAEAVEQDRKATINNFFSINGSGLNRVNYRNENKWEQASTKGEKSGTEASIRSARANVATQALMANTMLSIKLKATQVNEILKLR